MAVFTANKRSAKTQKMRPKQLSPEARAIFDRIPAALKQSQSENKASAIVLSDISKETQDAEDKQVTSAELGSGGGDASNEDFPYFLGATRK